MIIQLLPSLAYGDAVGNDTLALDALIRDMGYKTVIYADAIDERLPKGVAKYTKHMPKPAKDDIVIYHLSTGTELSYIFGRLNCKKVVMYHNITPARFFEKYNDRMTQLVSKGEAEARWLSDKVDFCIADSEYNRQELISMGYKCPIEVLPILIPFKDYDKPADKEIISRYSDGYTNILFTGRIAPNKCQEDVIRSFAMYKKYYNSKSRLILVGGDGGFENYRCKLERYGIALGVTDIVFAGHITFAQMLAFYKVADLFVCQSEHEGFCVPLVEAMYFGVPIVAYNSSAVGETLMGAGMLLDKKDAVETAAVMDYIIKNDEIRGTIAANRKRRLKDFAYETVAVRFKEIFKNIIV